MVAFAVALSLALDERLEAEVDEVEVALVDRGFLGNEKGEKPRRRNLRTRPSAWMNMDMSAPKVTPMFSTMKRCTAAAL